MIKCLEMEIEMVKVDLNSVDSKKKNAITDFHLPRFYEITNVGLYLEQTVKFINNYLKPLGEPEITGSMASNYVKHKLLQNPIKKQYYTEHIARLIFITIMKNSMSMDNITLLMELQKAQYDPEMAYDYFCDEFENVLSYVFDNANEIKTIGKIHSETKDLLTTAIIAVANRIYLDRCLDDFRNAESRGNNL